MSCGARNLLNYENTIQLPSSENLDISYNDVKLNLKLFNKYFEVNTLDEILTHRRNQFKTRKEQLQKRQEALHEKENTLKERIISYEMYIKELAMKHDRSLRRVNDEKNFIKTKRIEIDLFKQQIEQIQEEKLQLQKTIFQYKPHLNYLTQMIDRTDRFHSIDEIIEKFDILYASYQDILSAIKNSNEELNQTQRQLLLTIEKKNTQILSMNNRIHELEKHLLDIHQRIENIQTEIESYQQISTERLTELGSIKISIESMFDLVKRYSRKKSFNLDDSLLTKIKQIDIFLSNLIYYVDYVNNKQKKIISKEHSINSDNIKLKQENIPDDNSQWRSSCELNQRAIIEKTIDQYNHQSYFSYKVKGEDDMIYTIQMIEKSNPSQERNSLTRKQSSISNKGRKSRILKTSTSKFQSTDTQPRSSTTRSIHTNVKLINYEKIPFAQSELTHQTSILKI